MSRGEPWAGGTVVRLTRGADARAAALIGIVFAVIALGVGLRGRAGGPATVREGTAALLRQLMAAQLAVPAAK